MKPGNRWRKSSYSGNGVNCVEVGNGRDAVLIRDTKDDGTGPVLRVSAARFREFLSTVRK